MQAAIAAVVVATAFAVLAYQDGVLGRARVGRPAPALTLPEASGRPWSLASLRGRVVVLTFWASWCEVCSAEAPALEAFARRYGGPGGPVAVVGVDWREPTAVLTAYVRAHGLTFVNVRDADGSAAARYGLTGVPETWFIGPGGVARLHILGGQTFEQLQADYRAATGRSIDGGGVGPLRAGERAYDGAWVGRTLWLATSSGLWRTADGGRTWRRGGPPALADAPVRLLAAAGDRLYAAGTPGGLWVSGDGGDTWRPAAAGLPAAAVEALTVDPASPARVWAWVRGAGLYRTVGGGGRWARVAAAGGLPAPPRALAVGAGGLWAATDRGVMVSRDGGRHWRPVPLWQTVSPSAELDAPTSVLRSRVPLVAAGIAAQGRAVYFAGPDGIWRYAGSGGGLLSSSPARAFAAVFTGGPATGPRGAAGGARGDTLWALAPNGDLYAAPRAGAVWSWRPYPSGSDHRP